MWFFLLLACVLPPTPTLSAATVLSRFLYTGARAASSASADAAATVSSDNTVAVARSSTAPAAQRATRRRPPIEIAYADAPATPATSAAAAPGGDVAPATAPAGRTLKRKGATDGCGDVRPAEASATPSASVEVEKEEPRATKAPRAGPKPLTPPAHWRQQYDNVVKMRAKRDAPVDTIGCEVRHWSCC